MCAGIACAAAGRSPSEAPGNDPNDAGSDGGATEPGVDGGASDGGISGCGAPGGDAGCYAIACKTAPESLRANRDRLIADLATRKRATSCSLWAALNLAERDVFLMVTAYLGDSSSRLYPPGSYDSETALDHATALYSINGPKAGQGIDGSGRGGFDYNRLYLGFDDFAKCVVRNFAAANPARAPGFNLWQKSDDVAGPHRPFTRREMIFWYRALYDLSSNGPQFHHWAADADFDGGALDQRLGVCGVTDRSLTELTVAFDAFHNSDPLGDYAGRGGFGWQIVGQHLGIDPEWSYTPSSCEPTPPVNADPYGGGTFAGMGPVLDGGSCSSGVLGN